jgi:signal transduction histidine kinase/ActR/RegA family two-component response regulator
MSISRTLTIRSHLLLLATGAVLPILAFGVLVSIVLVDLDRHTIQRGAMERARAMMTAVDAELRGSLRTVEALTASAALQRDDLAAFHAEAERVLATHPAWVDVTLASASGEKIVDAARPFGSPLARIIDPASAERAVRTRAPVIGNVDQIDAAAPSGVPVRVPVVHGDTVVYVLSALVRPDSFQDLIRQQRLPDDWISGIVDTSGRYVARAPSRHAGEMASVPFREAVRDAAEGWYRGRTVEGRDTFTAFERSDFSGWSIGLAIPAEIVQAAGWRTAWLMGIGVLASVGVALAIAASIGRQIASPIVALASVARSIGTGSRRTVAVGGKVAEVKAVATALREADAAVRERESLIQRERDALEAADRAKDEFIATLSHELRNPLAALTAAAHILRVADPAHSAAKDARSVIDRQALHMARMVEDLLDVSRLIAGKVTLVTETFDLGQLAANVVENWRATGRFAGRIVSVHAEPVWVTADRTRLEQIVSNLLDNAVKFTSPGQTIMVEARRNDRLATLSVADQGEGIPPELVDRVFDLFVQGEQGVGRSKGGIGLGLTLVKRLAQLHGGSVWAASGGVGRGATFTVRLPAAAIPAHLAGRGVGDERAGGAYRILIVEDNADARAMLHELLAMSGHDVHEAADGRSAIALAARLQPDIAIVDIGLPDIDGYEVARHLDEQSGGHIGLIALTGYGQPRDQRRALAAGFDLHLVKPVAIDRLDEAIATLTSRAASGDGRAPDRAVG